MYKRLTNEQKEKIVELYKSGQTLEWLAKHFELCEQTIGNYIRLATRSDVKKQIEDTYDHLVCASFDDQFCITLKSNVKKDIKMHKRQLEYLLNKFNDRLKKLYIKAERNDD